jgi:hypothetical protein
VGNGVVEVDVAVEPFCVVGQNAIAKCCVAYARASEGVERDAGIGEAAEGEDGESGAEAVTGETDFCVRMLAAIVCDQRVDLLPDLIQCKLKASMDEAWLGEEMADEGEVSEGWSRILRNGPIVGFVDEQDVGIGGEVARIVSLGTAKGA